MSINYESFMKEALKLAKEAANLLEVPVGAVPRVVSDHVRDDARAHQARQRGAILAEAGLRRPAEKQPVGRDVFHDAVSFCNFVLPGRRALQLLPPLRGQGCDV